MISKPSTAERGEESPTLRDRLTALRYLPAFLRLVWLTHRGYAAMIIAMRLARAFVPVTTLWVGKLIIDEVVAATQGTTDLSALWHYVALEIAIVVAGDLLARGSALVESLLGDLFLIHVSVRIMEHAATLDLEQFEDPNFYDHLERARRETAGGGVGLLTHFLAAGQDLLTVATLGAALMSYSVWLSILLLLAIIPSFLGETHFAALEYSLLFRYTPQRRMLNYLSGVAASERTAKEVKIFGLARWLIGRYGVLATRFYGENKSLSTRKSIVASLLSLIGTGGYYVAYVVIILAAVRGAISIGQLIFLVGSFSQSRALVQRLLLVASDIYEKSLYLNDLFIFFEMRPRLRSGPGAFPVPTPIREGFLFEDVGFRYPGSDRWAVRHVNFLLLPGECIALVGENGAGKTTLTKLLARLYDPTEGRITLDGVDLREYDLASLCGSVGVIFQDFMRYDMCFDENIGVGQIDRVQAYLDSTQTHPAENGIGAVPMAVRTAAEQSLASTLLPRFPAGYRQMLGRRFDGGVDLSGGEWQKIALARAYMRMSEGQVLILDEPTAALDARAEYEIFQSFQELTHGRMAVLISHRFSTVRMADRIVVLDGGTVVEDGTHKELLAYHGVYAELFGMQAAGYR
jgi:ATP-binding cassette subfamily B protein